MFVLDFAIPLKILYIFEIKTKQYPRVDIEYLQSINAFSPQSPNLKISVFDHYTIIYN